MSTKFLSPGWRMPKNANQSKQSNYSMDFDGANDYIDTGFIPADKISGNFTISAYVDCGNIGGGIGVDFICGVQNYGTTGKRFGFGVYDNNAPKYYYMFGSLGAISFTISNNPKNGWTHLAVTYDGTNLRFYSNGTLDGTTNVGALSALPTSNMYIGARNKVNPNDDAVDFFDGKMEQVCIFDYALSLSQVTTLYGDSTNGPGNPMALPSSPIAYYPLGTSAWNGNFLAENNAIGDYVFDFIPNDYVQTGGFTIGNNYTFSCWLKSDTTSPSDMCFLSSPNYYTVGYNGNFVIRFTSATQIQMYSYNERSDSESSTVTIPSIDTNWHHFALTSNGTTTNIYWDGSPLTVTGNQTKSLDNISQGLIIGHNITGNNNAFNGEISNVQVFNTALSATEVETLYNYGSPIQTLANIPQSSNLKAWYKLDASEIYNSTSTEWSVDNNQNPSAYPSSLDFSGTSQYISCSSSSVFQNTSNFSVSFWVNMDDYSGGGCFLMSQGSGSNIFHIYAYSGNTIQVRLRKDGLGNGTISNINLNNKWNNICLVYDGTQTGNSNMLKFYLNKVEQTISFNSNIQSSINISSNFLIGQQSGQSGIYTIDGKLSNVSLFSNSLTDGTGGTLNQIETLYNNGTPLADMSSFSSLVSWWKLDNTTTGIEDSKGSNNGTNNGATEYPGFVNTLAGESIGMSQSNLVQSDLQTVAPYSKYALSFDGTNDYIDCGDSDSFSFGNGTTDSSFSISAWVNMIDATNFITIAKDANSGREYVIRTLSDDKLYFYLLDNINGGYIGRISSGTVTSNQGTWIHTLYTYNGNSTSSGIKIYLNGSQVDNANYEGGSYTAMSNTSTNLNVGRQERGLHYGSGSISNVSIFDSALTSSQVREIYNEGLPSDLNTFSGAAPVAWWQLGSNSSWNGNRWIVADEIGSNNGYSQNMSPYMPESGLTNGVGTTANGVSSGMSEGSLVGDAPYSTANAVSSGMSVVSRVTGVSDATITTGGTGYSTGTNIATTGGSGTNCTINITTVSGGAITAITINSGGNDYLIGDVLTVSGGNGNATITVSGLNTP